MKKIIYIFLFTLLSIKLVAQIIVYTENINHKLTKPIQRNFLINDIDKISVISLYLTGYDFIINNVYPNIELSVNNKILFEGVLSKYTFGKNNQIKEIEFDITDFVKNGTNSIKIKYKGYKSESYLYLSKISILKKDKGSEAKTLKNFNYDEKKYIQYLKDNLSIGTQIIAISDYGLIKKGTQGIYYGDFFINPSFCSVKWNKKINLPTPVAVSKNYPQDQLQYAYNIPYALIQIIKINTSLNDMPPEIKLFTAENTKVNTNEINITGRANDADGIYAVFINNIKAPIDNKGFFNSNIRLNMGINKIKIKAVDKFGNSAYSDISIERIPSSEQDKPKLNIFYPLQNNLTVKQNIINIKGKAIDKDYISYLKIKNNNSDFMIFIENNKEFNVKLSLQKGQNIIKLTAYDELENPSETKEYKITFEPSNQKPTIELINPANVRDNTVWIDPNITDITIKAKVYSPNSIKQVNLTYLNGPNTQNFSLQDSTYILQTSLPLEQNITLKFQAIDIYGNTAEYILKLNRKKRQDPFPDIDKDIPINPIQNTDVYVLIISNSHYDEEKSLFNSLPYVQNDGDIFRKYLINTFGIPSKNIKLLQSVKTIDFAEKINEFSTTIKLHKEAKFIFYYSGHGAIDDNGAYFVPTDYNRDVDIYEFVKKLYVDSVIYNLLYSQPKKLTVFLDMCYSGKSNSKGVIVSANNSFNFEGPIVIFTASDKEAYPFLRRNHSIFTYALLKAIHDTKGQITYKKLYEEIKLNVEKIINEENLKFNQTPQVFPSSVLDTQWEQWKLP